LISQRIYAALPDLVDAKESALFSSRASSGRRRL